MMEGHYLRELPLNKPAKNTASAWQAKVQALPQYPGIEPETSQLWIERAQAMDPEDRDRLIAYMGRLDADDMGAMIADKRKRWHPHTTPANVVRTKLLQERPKSEPAYKARRRLMTPIARDMFHRQVENAGAIHRPELVEKVLTSVSAKHPWLSLASVDFIEENGRVVLVEYRTPSEPMALSTRGMSFHHEVSMHYALLAAREAGVRVDALRMCALDAKAWSVEAVDLTMDQGMAEEIRQEGDRVWKENILAGKIIPPAPMHGIMDLNDLKKPGVGGEGAAEILAKLAERYLAWGVAEKECAAEREVLQGEAADALPFAALPLDVERVDAGGVRFRIDRELDIDGLAALAKDLMVQRGGMCEEDAAEHLNHANYWNDPEYSAKGLIQAIETHFDIDPTQDPRFSTAVSKPAQRRVDTLLDLIRSLDPEDSLRLENYVRAGKMRMEMVAPRARFEREQRAQASEQVRGVLKEAMDGVCVQAAIPADSPRRGSRRP